MFQPVGCLSSTKEKSEIFILSFYIFYFQKIYSQESFYFYCGKMIMNYLIFNCIKINWAFIRFRYNLSLKS